MDFYYYNSLAEATKGLAERGFTSKFKFDNEQLLSLSNGQIYEPNELKIVEHHRFEGKNNAANDTVLFALEFEDGNQGTVVIDYSADTIMDLFAFIDKVKIKLSPENSYL